MCIIGSGDVEGDGVAVGADVDYSVVLCGDFEVGSGFVDFDLCVVLVGEFVEEDDVVVGSVEDVTHL